MHGVGHAARLAQPSGHTHREATDHLTSSPTTSINTSQKRLCQTQRCTPSLPNATRARPVRQATA
jgi:hypothetical protein